MNCCMGGVSIKLNELNVNCIYGKCITRYEENYMNKVFLKNTDKKPKENCKLNTCNWRAASLFRISPC